MLQEPRLWGGTGVVVLLVVLLLLVAACGAGGAQVAAVATPDAALAGLYQMAPVKTATPTPEPATTRTPRPTNTRVIDATPPAASDAAKRTTADIPRIGVEEAKARVEAGEAILADVRALASYNRGHIAGAISVPANEVANRAGELPTDKLIIFYCA